MSSDGLWCLLTWLALPLGDLYGVCPRSIRTDVDGSVSKTTTVMATLLSFALGGKHMAQMGASSAGSYRQENGVPAHPALLVGQGVRMSPSCFPTYWCCQCHVSLPSSSGIPCIYLPLALHYIVLWYLDDMPISRNVCASRKRIFDRRDHLHQ
jgi:hypothetical protein